MERYLQSRAGSTVLLTCGDGEGDEKAKWSKDGVSIAADKGRVWLHNVSHTHEGEYTCSYGKESHNYYFSVHSKFDAGSTKSSLIQTPPVTPPVQYVS